MSTDDTSRPLFVCQDPACGRHFLPPSTMEYPTGPASEAYCATCAPNYSSAEAARPGFNLADNMIRPRTRGHRRAGHSPTRRERTGRSKLG